jgi:hypothetical protein
MGMMKINVSFFVSADQPAVPVGHDLSAGGWRRAGFIEASFVSGNIRMIGCQFFLGISSLRKRVVADDIAVAVPLDEACFSHGEYPARFSRKADRGYRSIRAS